LTEIVLKRDFYDEEAEKLKLCFSPGVIGLVDIKGRKQAVVLNPRLDSCSRQVYMHEEFKDDVEINKIRNHFICNFFIIKLSLNFFIVYQIFFSVSIESTGAVTAEDLMKESIKILMKKTEVLLNEINSKKN
jgi:hypothetical protein